MKWSIQCILPYGSVPPEAHNISSATHANGVVVIVVPVVVVTVVAVMVVLVAVVIVVVVFVVVVFVVAVMVVTVKCHSAQHTPEKGFLHLLYQKYANVCKRFVGKNDSCSNGR